MIPVEALRAVRKIIVHANCPDGRASALILHAALPVADIVEMSYGEPAHDRLAAEPGMLFCDFTPPKDRLAEFAATGAIVLDHHERALVEPFGERGIFGENDAAESGAWLAWRHVYYVLKTSRAWPVEVAEARDAAALAEGAAIRDTWQRDSPLWDDACALSEALRFVPLPDALSRGVVRMMALSADIGPLLLAKKRAEAAKAAANALRYTIRPGLRVAVVPSRGLTEDVADILGDSVDVVAGFEYVHEAEGGRIRMQWSLRSRGSVDVQRIAKHFGGGGHKKAAGFGPMVTTDPFAHPAEHRNPYAWIHGVLRDISLVPPGAA